MKMFMNPRKILVFTIITCILLTSIPIGTSARTVFTERPDVEVLINGSKLSSNDVVIQQNGSFLLPFRPFLLALGIPDNPQNISYNMRTRTVTVNFRQMSLQLTVDSRTALVNNQRVSLDVAPLTHSRTMRVYVPVRFVSQTFNQTVVFDQAKKLLRVNQRLVPNSNPNPNPNQNSTPNPTPPYVKPAGISVVTSADGVILHNQFPSTILNNKRTIRVYLPPSYRTNTTQRYPVFYMNDGQNLFGAGSAFGSWKADATANQLTALNIINEVILVGIDNTSNRANEYNFGAGGIVDGYAKFVTSEVMPYINHEYRTLTGPQNTGIIGSSYGGNSALYIGWNYPQLFGNVGVFSSTLVWNDFALLKQIQSQIGSRSKSQKYCIYVGDLEKLDEDGNGLSNYAEWTMSLAKTFYDAGWKVGEHLIYMIGENAVHNEAAWAAHLDQPFRFFFGKTSKPQPQSLTVKMSASEIDTAGTIPNVWVFPYVNYSNGMRTIFPDATLSAGALQFLERSFDQLTLRNRLTTPAQVLPLNYTFGSLRGTANLNIIRQSQNKVKVSVEVLAPPSNVQKIYMTGDFSAWGQNINSDYILTRAGDVNGRVRYSATIVLDRNKTLTFKFRSGPDWKFVEKRSDGGETVNRQLRTTTVDTNVSYTVDRWNSTP